MAIANVSLGATTSATAASKTTITVTPSTAPTNGDSLVVIGSHVVTGTGSFTDNGVPANSYTVQATKTNGVQVDLGTVLSVAGSPTSITYSNTPTKGAITICVAEYSGVSAFGTTGSNTGSTSPANVSVTTQDSNDWLVGGGTNNSLGTLTAGASTNNRSTNTTNIDSWLFDSGAVATPASTTLNETLGTPASWATVAVVLRPPSTASGAGTERATAAEKLSQAVSGAGTEKTSSSFVLSQKTSGAGAEKSATSFVLSQKTSGAGLEKTSTAFVVSQTVSGVGLEKTTVGLVASQKVSGAGTEKGVGIGSTAGVSASGSGTEKAAATTLLSQKTSGAGLEKTTTAFVLSQKLLGAGIEKASSSQILSQKVSGAGAEKTGTSFVVSQRASGAGAEKTGTTLILSQTGKGSGSFKATATVTTAGGAAVSTTGSGGQQAFVTVSVPGSMVGFFWGPVGPQRPAYGCAWFNSKSGKWLYWNGFGWVTS